MHEYRELISGYFVEKIYNGMERRIGLNMLHTFPGRNGVVHAQVGGNGVDNKFCAMLTF